MFFKIHNSGESNVIRISLLSLSRQMSTVTPASADKHLPKNSRNFGQNVNGPTILAWPTGKFPQETKRLESYFAISNHLRGRYPYHLLFWPTQGLSRAWVSTSTSGSRIISLIIGFWPVKPCWGSSLAVSSCREGRDLLQGCYLQRINSTQNLNPTVPF